MQHILKTVIILSLFISTNALRANTESTFTFWQLPSQTTSQMMSFVIQTQHKKLIVIDGGMKGDAEYLTDFLAKRGGDVTAWFITHPHPDHVNALSEILASGANLKIDRIYASLPSEEWVKQYEPAYINDVAGFNIALKKAGKTAINLPLGAQFNIDHVKIIVLGIKNPEITNNAMNNSSVVLKFSDDAKSVLFLADLGYEGGEKLLHSYYGRFLKSDYVQMAHHGQNGVGKDVYEAVNPKYCLWTTPIWLWNNDSGKGKNSGPWKTLEVRKWMEELNVKKNYVMKDGLCCIK